jgi:dehydrogenase/reductase SDR family protein 7B
MTENFRGKVIWITGASSGIGEALARAFAADGAYIILSGRRIEALEKVANDLATDTLILPFEATDFEVLPAKITKAQGWKGRVDILVNNAGISQRSLAIDTHPTVHQMIIDVDLLAPIWLTQLLLPHMVNAGGGHIVGISSVAGRIGAPLRTAYSAAKHGLIGYMDALRAETEKLHNIHVTNILPGSIRTDVSRNALTKDGKRRGKSDAVIENGMDPADCAKQIVQAVADHLPELIIAEGPELMMARLRQSDPEKLFAMLNDFGAETAERYQSGDDN